MLVIEVRRLPLHRVVATICLVEERWTEDKVHYRAEFFNEQSAGSERSEGRFDLLVPIDTHSTLAVVKAAVDAMVELGQ